LWEGWDAPAANVLIDLTAATTATAVVQVRGRAIRRDPARPDKVAHVWSVVAVDDEHPRGDLDYRRLVAKHRGYLAPDGQGRVVAGVEHLDARLSRYTAPVAAVRDAVNATALDVAARPDQTRAAWRVGQPFRDVVETAVRVRSPRAVPVGAPEPAVPRRPGLVGLAAVSALASAGVVAAVTGVPVAGALGIGLVAALAVVGLSVVGRRWRQARAQRRLGFEGLFLAFGRAIAGGLPGAAPEQVVAAAAPGGAWVVRLEGADAGLSAQFAAAFEQVVSPVDYPRYVIDRRVGLRAVMWHAVPDVAGVNREAAEQFASQWRRFVGRGRLLYTGSAEGAGVAQAVRGLDPMDLTSALSAEWT
jgi:hypothetical protein